jgi:hypothetical protein
MDSLAGNTSHLLSSISPTPSNKGTKSFKFSYHPTFLLRLLVLLLLITALILLSVDFNS